MAREYRFKGAAEYPNVPEEPKFPFDVEHVLALFFEDIIVEPFHPVLRSKKAREKIKKAPIGPFK